MLAGEIKGRLSLIRCRLQEKCVMEVFLLSAVVLLQNSLTITEFFCLSIFSLSYNRACMFLDILYIFRGVMTIWLHFTIICHLFNN